MIELREYVDSRGRSPFGRWFDGLDAGAAARVRTSLARMEAGNLFEVISCIQRHEGVRLEVKAVR